MINERKKKDVVTRRMNNTITQLKASSKMREEPMEEEQESEWLISFD